MRLFGTRGAGGDAKDLPIAAELPEGRTLASDRRAYGGPADVGEDESAHALLSGFTSDVDHARVPSHGAGEEQSTREAHAGKTKNS